MSTGLWNSGCSLYSMVEPYKKGKDIRIMIWGAIWIGGRSDVMMMVRDEASPKKGFSRYSYLEVLEEAIPSCWQPGQIFMQDNAPIHTANVIQRVLRKTWLQKNRPELCQGGKSEEDYAALGRAIVEAWDAIPQRQIDHLIETMKRPCREVKKAKGCHKKY